MCVNDYFKIQQNSTCALMFVMILMENPIKFKRVIKCHVQCVLRFSKMCVVSLDVMSVYFVSTYGALCNVDTTLVQRTRFDPFRKVFTHCALLSALSCGNRQDILYIWFIFCFVSHVASMPSQVKSCRSILHFLLCTSKKKDGCNFRGCVYNFVVLFFISAHGCCVAAVATVKQYGHIVIS